MAQGVKSQTWPKTAKAVFTRGGECLAAEQITASMIGNVSGSECSRLPSENSPLYSVDQSSLGRDLFADGYAVRQSGISSATTIFFYASIVWCYSAFFARSGRHSARAPCYRYGLVVDDRWPGILNLPLGAGSPAWWLKPSHAIVG